MRYLAVFSGDFLKTSFFVYIVGGNDNCQLFGLANSASTNVNFLSVSDHPSAPLALVKTRRHHEKFKNLTNNTPQPKKNSGPLEREKLSIDPAITLVGKRPERQKKTPQKT